jgi:hypothetical protein
MRILVTLESTDPTIDEIMWYCDRHKITFCMGDLVCSSNSYILWRIYAEPSKYVDYLLLKYSNHLVVY